MPAPLPVPPPLLKPCWRPRLRPCRSVVPPRAHLVRSAAGMLLNNTKKGPLACVENRPWRHNHFTSFGLGGIFIGYSDSCYFLVAVALTCYLRRQVSWRVKPRQHVNSTDQSSPPCISRHVIQGTNYVTVRIFIITCSFWLINDNASMLKSYRTL